MEDYTIFKDKTVLITGGTGSFGKTCARMLLEQDVCQKVIIFSRDEWKQWQMTEQDPIFSHPKIRYFLGDIRDPERLKRAFSDVHYVIHAAALKQVPAAEYNPSEFVKTNVNGAMNIIDAAIEARVEKVIALSTDKAVNPVNLYGATKLCSDKLFIAANAYVGKRERPVFSVVRYGNVLGSRGSLLPHWKALLAKGETSLPITDERMTRFWITLEQAVQFVTLCTKRAVGGEIFIPKIPSVRIVDLAKALMPEPKYTICGIRPGEKIHEVLLSEDDSRSAYECSDCFIQIPLHTNRAYSHWAHEKKVAPGYIFSSNTNPMMLQTIDEVKQLIREARVEK